MAKIKEVKLTLVRSLIGRLPKHRATIASLGLNRIRQSVIHKDTLDIRGKINQVAYLLKIEESA